MSPEEICNLALIAVGSGNTITDLNQATKEARICKARYAHTRDAILRAHPWNFAIKRATLASDATAPDWEYTARYALPSDCLRLIRTYDDTQGAAPDYRVEGKYIVNDDGTSDSLQIEYVAQITDTAQFTPEFVDVLAARLAAEICINLTENKGATESLWNIYQEKLREARNTDAQEGVPRGFDAVEWITARL